MLQKLTQLAHAGVEHGSEAEAAAHESGGATTTIIVITAATIFILAIAVRFLTKDKSSSKQDKTNSDSRD